MSSLVPDHQALALPQPGRGNVEVHMAVAVAIAHGADQSARCRYWGCPVPGRTDCSKPSLKNVQVGVVGGEIGGAIDAEAGVEHATSLGLNGSISRSVSQWMPTDWTTGRRSRRGWPGDGGPSRCCRRWWSGRYCRLGPPVSIVETKRVLGLLGSMVMPDDPPCRGGCRWSVRSRWDWRLRVGDLVDVAVTVAIGPMWPAP